MDKKRFKIYTLGCKVNQYDSADLKNLLLLNSFEYNENYCDLIIINSCSVTKVAITKCRRLINRIRREHRDAKIVLIGCWPRVYQDIKEKVDLIWRGRSDNWESLLKELEELDFDFSFYNFKNNLTTLKNIEDRKRYFVKIQDGCQQFCSYCIIPYSRGILRSREPEDVISEIKSAIDNSYQEIVLSGIHIGLYGTDFKRGEYNLYKLLKEIVGIKGEFRVRLSSIEPNEISSDIIRLFARNKKLCPSFHIPLQAGSDKILKLMNRPYNRKFFIKKIERIKKHIPNVSISVDLIVGFPGEEENDFLDSYNLIKELAFSKVHVFSFSAHEKTPAYSMDDKVPTEVIKKRSEKIRKLSDVLEKRYQKKILKEEKELYYLLEKFCPKKSELKNQFGFNIFLDSKKNGISEDFVGRIIKIKK
jgi:threonylcarbamoyladenosine tRNA methylthiotransferase MtaB